MNIDSAKISLLNKARIIDQSHNDHWLLEPIHIALQSMEELETTEKELNVYKKALKMACEELGDFCCTQTMLTHRCDSNCSIHWKDYFLEKARKKNNGQN